MFLGKLQLERIRKLKEQEEYARMMERNLREERKMQEYREMLRKREEAEKKKQQYYQQKNHISYLSKTGARPKTQPGKMSKTTMDSFNPTKKKTEVIKNTEKLLTLIYKDQLPRPGSKKSRGLSSRGNSGTKKTMENLEPKQSREDDSQNMDTLFRLFSKNIEYN